MTPLAGIPRGEDVLQCRDFDGQRVRGHREVVEATRHPGRARGSVLRGALERDDGQMSTSGVIADRDVERDSRLTADERLRRGARRASRPPWAGFEAWCLGRRATMMVDLVGSGSAESRVRPVAVVPGDVERQFLLDGDETVWDQNQSPGALVLDGSDAALDHDEAAVLADGAEPLRDTATATPALELPGGELAALVGDKALGLMALEKALQKLPNCSGGGLAAEDGEARDASRVVIHGNGHPPAERPHLRQGEGTPRGPEPGGGRHGREIDVPEVIRLSGGDLARSCLESRAGDRRSCLPQHPAHCRGTEVETCTGEDLGDLYLAHGGAEDLEMPHEVADEVGEFVHRLRQADDGVWAFFVDPRRPGGDGGRSHEEGAGSLRERPTACGPQLEDRQPRCRRIVGPSLMRISSRSNWISCWSRSISARRRRRGLRLRAARPRAAVRAKVEREIACTAA